MDASIGRHHTNPELAGHGRLFAHAVVVAEAANGRYASPSEFVARVLAHEWPTRSAPDLTEAGHSVLVSLCSLVAERRRRGRPSRQNRPATGDLRDYHLECQHRT